MNNYGESDNPVKDSKPSLDPHKMYASQNAPINLSSQQLILSKETTIDEDQELKTKEDDNKVTTYAMFILGILTVIRIATQWQQKSIGYFYGFSGLGEMAGNPRFEISSAYPELQ